jgi:nanoRNase/pAp phosphatase (c-di-AMP/oligoRNAs hydrolase)
VRTAAGATAILLTQYLQAAQLELPPPLATALFYGLKTDTMGLSRGASPDDVAAYLYLQSRAEVDALMAIERAQVPVGYIKSFDTALRAARLYGSVVVSYIGPMEYPDMAAEIADLLLRLEGIEWVICLGYVQIKHILALRTRSRTGGAGQLAQAVVGNLDAAGGHGSMAGGQVPLQGKDPNRLARRLIGRALQHLAGLSRRRKGQPAYLTTLSGFALSLKRIPHARHGDDITWLARVQFYFVA